MEKPPIGLMPEKIYEELSNTRRIEDILEAMKRYACAGKPIPIEWVRELEKRIYGQKID